MAIAISEDNSDCPLSVEAVRRYVGVEDADVRPTDVDFRFRALCGDRIFWIWSFQSFGVLTYVVVRKLLEGYQPESVVMYMDTPEDTFETPEDLATRILEREKSFES